MEESDVMDEDDVGKLPVPSVTIEPDPDKAGYFQCSWVYDPEDPNDDDDLRLKLEALGIQPTTKENSVFVSFHADKVSNVRDILQECGFNVHYTEEASRYETAHFEDPEQRIQALMNLNADFMITGEGGTGKSHMIYKCYAHLASIGKRVALTATTGVAAQLLEAGANERDLEVKAHTLHSFLGLPRQENMNPDKLLECIRIRGAESNWIDTDYIIIDEVSMLTGSLLNMIYNIATSDLRNPKSRMRFILVGDFFQLGPQSSTSGNKKNYCFNATCFQNFRGNIVHLKENHRMKDDPQWRQLLLHLRTGTLTSNEETELKKRSSTAVGEPIPPDTLCLYPTREQANMVNNERINTFHGDQKTYKAQVVSIKTKRKNLTRNINLDNEPSNVRNQIERVITAATRDLMRLGKNEDVVPLRLKVGAPVVCNKNKKAKAGNRFAIKNGMRGTVVKLLATKVVVNFGGDENFDVGYETQNYEDVTENGDLCIVSIKYIPLSLSFASTIHRIQGATLDNVYIKFTIDCPDGTERSGCFDGALVYVALSRARSIEGVYMDGIDEVLTEGIAVDQDVINFYENLKSRSEEPVFIIRENWMDKKIKLQIPTLLQLYKKTRTKRIMERERRRKVREHYKQRTERNTIQIISAMKFVYGKGNN